VADDMAVKSSSIVTRSRDVARERWTDVKDDIDNARLSPVYSHDCDEDFESVRTATIPEAHVV
jgi:hypothetical protein